MKNSCGFQTRNDPKSLFCFTILYHKLHYVTFRDTLYGRKKWKNSAKFIRGKLHFSILLADEKRDQFLIPFYTGPTTFLPLSNILVIHYVRVFRSRDHLKCKYLSFMVKLCAWKVWIHRPFWNYIIAKRVSFYQNVACTAFFLFTLPTN